MRNNDCERAIIRTDIRSRPYEKRVRTRRRNTFVASSHRAISHSPASLTLDTVSGGVSSSGALPYTTHLINEQLDIPIRALREVSVSPVCVRSGIMSRPLGVKGHLCDAVVSITHTEEANKVLAHGVEPIRPDLL